MSTPTIARPSSVKLSRSPIFITGKNNTLPTDDLYSMDFELYLYTGLRTAVPVDPNYKVAKDYAIDRKINFEISNLISDLFYHTPFIWNTVGISASPLGEVLWVNYIGSWTYSNAGTPASGMHTTGNTNAFLATDGWAKQPNYTNLPVNQTNYFVPRPRYVQPNAYEVLAIANSGTAAAWTCEISWSNGDSGQFEWSGGTNPPNYSLYSDRAVVYWGVGPQNLNNNSFLDNLLKPENHECGESYTLTFYNDVMDVLHQEIYTLTCECKYQPYQLAFVNRYGMVDFMTWFKRSDESIEFSSEQYKASVYQDGFSTYNSEVRVYTDYNLNGRQSVTLNSDWVHEVYGEVLEDILMSKECWLLVDGLWLAVNPERSTLEVKKEVNDHVINYTMKFIYANNERPLIR